MQVQISGELNDFHESNQVQMIKNFMQKIEDYFSNGVTHHLLVIDLRNMSDASKSEIKELKNIPHEVLSIAESLSPDETNNAMLKPRLTKREIDVLTLIAKGLSYNEIANMLIMSSHTVTSHIKNIYRKLSVHSRGEAAFEAMQLGLIN